MSEVPDKLYHYTNRLGLAGILKSGTVWATQISHLNDETEYVGAFEIAQRLAREESRFHRFGHQLVDQLQRDLTPDVNSIDWRSVFVTCFTTEEDDLSQWRGYTPWGEGFNVGFEGRLLEGRAKANGWRLEKCVYGLEAERLIKGLLEGVFEEYQRGRFEAAPDPASVAARLFRQGLLTKYAAIVKHDGFKGEHEWRLISPAYEGAVSKLLQRQRGTLTIPYITFPFRSPGDTRYSVVQLTVGPGPDKEKELQYLREQAAEHPGVMQWCIATEVPYIERS